MLDGYKTLQIPVKEMGVQTARGCTGYRAGNHYFLSHPAVRKKNLDIFLPGHEGALFELLKHKVRGNNLESLGGSGRRLGSAGDDDEACEIDIHDEFESPDEKADQLDKRLQFEQVFCNELDQIDELNNLAGSDLGDAFGFTGANGRAVLSQLKKQIVDSAQKRFNANLQAGKQPSRAKARQQTATA